MDDILLLRLELVVDWNDEYHHDLGDRSARTTPPFLVHELVLSNRASAVLMTDFWDPEVRRNKIVSCFSDWSLLPIDHSLRLILWLEELPAWNIMCSFQFNGFSFKEDKVGLILPLWLGPCTAQMKKTPFWSSQHSFLYLPVERRNASILFLCPNFVFAQHLACLWKHAWSHRTAPSDSWLPVWLRIFVKCLEMSTNSQSLLVMLFAGINFQTR